MKSEIPKTPAVRTTALPSTIKTAALGALLAVVAPLSLAHATTTPLVMTRPPSATPTVRAVEAPPLLYADGPTLTGGTVMLELDDVGEVNHLCTQALGPAWARGYWMGCYNVRTDTVIVPAAGAWPSETERQALIAHEWAHARGWRHQADGRFGRPPAGVAQSAF